MGGTPLSCNVIQSILFNIRGRLFVIRSGSWLYVVRSLREALNRWDCTLIVPLVDIRSQSAVLNPIGAALRYRVMFYYFVSFGHGNSDLLYCVVNQGFR